MLFWQVNLCVLPQNVIFVSFRRTEKKAINIYLSMQEWKFWNRSGVWKRTSLWKKWNYGIELSIFLKGPIILRLIFPAEPASNSHLSLSRALHKVESPIFRSALNRITMTPRDKRDATNLLRDICLKVSRNRSATYLSDYIRTR